MRRVKPHEGFAGKDYLLFFAVTLAVLLLCICLGSVNISPGAAWQAIWQSAFGGEATADASAVILLVRLKRVLCVGLVGAALSLCGASMQGLLHNPLADGSTLGVSSGAALGAVLAIVLNITLPGLPFAGTMLMAMLFAFLSLLLILSLAQRLDKSFSTTTIILVGVIFSMFANSIISFFITFSGEKLRSITFWTMGSFSGSSYANVLAVLLVLLVFGTVLLCHARELNAFALGESNALHLGVNVRQVKLTVLVSVACLIGVCVAIGGSIGFVGLAVPHMLRMIVGPNHKRLLPASLFGGAIFLMLMDLLSRTVLRPLELPIGVVTSFIGAIVFVYVFYASRKGK